jgi:hypothetical protein
MTPEDVVLANGTTGLPWRGKGEPPKLPFIAWNVWILCILTFAMFAGQHISYNSMTRLRYHAIGVSDEKWFDDRKKTQPDPASCQRSFKTLFAYSAWMYDAVIDFLTFGEACYTRSWRV